MSKMLTLGGKKVYFEEFLVPLLQILHKFEIIPKIKSGLGSP